MAKCNHGGTALFVTSSGKTICLLCRIEGLERERRLQHTDYRIQNDKIVELQERIEELEAEIKRLREALEGAESETRRVEEIKDAHAESAWKVHAENTRLREFLGKLEAILRKALEENE